MDRYFIDESGHSGDLAAATDLDFAGQPAFSLACIGIKDITALEAELDRLRAKHGCGTGEIKSSALGSRLPSFAADLVAWLLAHDAAIFIELVEKRFFITIHLVNNLLCGGYSLDAVDQSTRSQLAESLSRKQFDAVRLAYMAACRSQSLVDIRMTLKLLWEALAESDEPTDQALTFLILEACRDASPSNASAERFLPLPDEGPTGKRVWMLPNLQCFTNIYGRVNRSRRRDLDGVTFVHHAQMQYDKVLGDGKVLLEQLAAEGAMPFVPFADYRIRGKVELAFASTEEQPCLQAADILAGCAMRYLRVGAKGKKPAALRKAFFDLYEAGDPNTTTGINLVASQILLDRLEIPNIPAAPFTF